MKPHLIIVRGLPGSGKSTIAEKIANKFNVAHFENDTYLMQDGKYIWTPDAAEEAAKRCFDDAMSELAAGRDAIVSNVFVTRRAVDKYVNAAKRLGAQVMVIRMNHDYGNAHNVPTGTLRSMRDHFEDYPQETMR